MLLSPGRCFQAEAKSFPLPPVQIQVQHPAAKSMIEISRTQDEEVGDGTTSVIILGERERAPLGRAGPFLPPVLLSSQHFGQHEPSSALKSIPFGLPWVWGIQGGSWESAEGCCRATGNQPGEGEGCRESSELLSGSWRLWCHSAVPLRRASLEGWDQDWAPLSCRGPGSCC